MDISIQTTSISDSLYCSSNPKTICKLRLKYCSIKQFNSFGFNYLPSHHFQFLSYRRLHVAQYTYQYLINDWEKQKPVICKHCVRPKQMGSDWARFIIMSTGSFIISLPAAAHVQQHLVNDLQNDYIYTSMVLEYKASI